jgi:hypothetical protein
MFGNSNSGDESRMSSNGGHTSDSPSANNNNNNNNQSIDFAIKLEKSQSPDFESDNGKNVDGELKHDNHSTVIQENGNSENENFAALNGQYSLKPENDIKKWCKKINEMPENIAAS